MINKENLEIRLTPQKYVSPFIKILGMESLPTGFSFITVDLDVRQLSHILESDYHYSRLCFKNGEIIYLSDNSDLPRIRYLKSQTARAEFVDEFLVLSN